MAVHQAYVHLMANRPRRICKPGDKLHVAWVTTEGGDYDNAALQMYRDAMQEAKVPF